MNDRSAYECRALACGWFAHAVGTNGHGFIVDAFVAACWVMFCLFAWVPSKMVYGICVYVCLCMYTKYNNTLRQYALYVWPHTQNMVGSCSKRTWQTADRLAGAPRGTKFVPHSIEDQVRLAYSTPTPHVGTLTSHVGVLLKRPRLGTASLQRSIGQSIRDIRI